MVEPLKIRSKILGILAVLVLLAPAARAQLAAAVRAFDEGNRQYRQGDYRAALDTYERAAAAGYVSGALFYNMGNAYYRLDELGQAIRYYERARALTPEDPALLHNLEIVRAHTRDQFSRLPEPFWVRGWERLVGLLGASGLFLAGLFFYLAAAALLAHRIWTGVQNPWHRRALVLSLCTGFLLLALSFAASIMASLDRSAVVVAEQVAVRQAPAVDAAAEIDIHEGLMLQILRSEERWIEVRLPNGTTGWIEGQAVAEI